MTQTDDPLDPLLRAAGVSVCRVSPSGVIAIDGELAVRLGLSVPCRLPDVMKRCDRASRAELAALIRGLFTSDAQQFAELRLREGEAEVWLRVTRVRGDTAALVVREITEKRRTIARLQESEEHWRCIVEFNPQWPWIADDQGQLIEITDRWLTATGLSRQAALGDSWRQLTHPDDVELVLADIIGKMALGRSFDVRARLLMAGEYRWMRARAYPRHNTAGEIIRWYGYTEDVHEQTLADERTRWNAEHDPLTGLANRAHFNVLLEQALGASLQQLERVGVLLIDLDHFKEVNDLHGHQAGDALLVSYAAQLTAGAATRRGRRAVRRR